MNPSGVTSEASAATGSDSSEPTLERTITLPWLVFYGVGVTVGAGIFALIGEILLVSGDHAPLAFLVAGAIAGFTGVSYMLLVSEFPRAGGEAIFVQNGLGTRLGRLAGLGVVATGIVSSAVVALAFGGYVGSLVAIPETIAAIALVILLATVAFWGVKESIVFAATVTLLEVGTLIIVIIFGLPSLGDLDVARATLSPGESGLTGPVLAGSVLAFFAFIGFEDLANMAEETVDARRTAPRAIAWTLCISVSLYVLLAAIAVAAPNRAEIVESSAPMAVLFDEVVGRGSDAVAVIAAIAMTNGILVQIVMASRVLYGMAKQQLIPASLGVVDRRHHTPARATLIIALLVTSLVAIFPLARLAQATSLVTLSVFAMVNLSLYRLGRSADGSRLWRFRYVGLIGAALAMALAGWQIIDGLSPGH